MSESGWSFDGADERRQLLGGLVARHIHSLDPLVPASSDDPLERLAAQLDRTAGPQLPDDPEVERLFPPAHADADEAAQFRADAVEQQAEARVEAARVVLRDLATSPDDEVWVPLDHMDAWLRTLTAIRVQWHVALTGSADRLAEPTPAQEAADPTAAALIDWLGYLCEDAAQALLLTRKTP